MKLYSYYRSSASYRVRIALNLKGIDYDQAAVNLLATEQKDEQYLAENPQGLIPALQLDSGEVIGQSTAILEWLEEAYPQPPLLPDDPLDRARVRSLVNHIACDVHPLNNLSILIYLKESLNADKEQIDQWYSQWINRGFASIEETLKQGNGETCFENGPGMADCYLIPQVYNALRFNVDISAYTAILSVFDYCNGLDAFHRAHPDQQPDAPA